MSYGMDDDEVGQPDTSGANTDAQETGDSEATEHLVATILKEIKADKKHHDKAFKRMRRDQQVATWGAEKEWSEDNYRANIAGRHVKQKTAALYAKNPKAVARQRETIDFKLWDESPDSLQLAMTTIQMAAAAQQMAQQSVAIDPIMGTPVQPQAQLPPGFEEAMALVEDYRSGMQRRQFIKKYGRTLEVLFAHAMREQKPNDFKRLMKQIVRRATTCGVAYIELGFQRETGPRPATTEKLADFRARLDHLRVLAEDVASGDIQPDDPEIAELEAGVARLQSEPEIVLREGLIFDAPQATKVIPDRHTKILEGFVGARHLAIEYMYSVQEVKELFGVDLENGYTKYTTNAGSQREVSANDVLDDDYEWSPPERKNHGMVCVWKYYDKASGNVYYVADGYKGFLRDPSAPDVFVEDFWPVYALTFNACENEDELFPPSDVALMLPMQREHNRSRQGLREHRHAARPRWVHANGLLDEEDQKNLKDMQPFETLALNIDPQTKMSDVLQPVPVPGVDPNLYETGPIFTDTQLVVGTQHAQMGGVAKATATETAVAADSSASADGSSIDELDSFLTVISRASGQILQREASPEKVFEVVGPGAVWPDLTLAEIASEVFLEVEAGSTGKPNQAVEVNNWQKMLPMLIQMPGIKYNWLAKETIRRLDDRLDLTEALETGLPSIMAANNTGPTNQPQGVQDTAADNPSAQGQNGASNAAKPPGQAGQGTGAAFGSNQVASPV